MYHNFISKCGEISNECVIDTTSSGICGNLYDLTFRNKIEWDNIVNTLDVEDFVPLTSLNVRLCSASHLEDYLTNMVVAADNLNELLAKTTNLTTFEMWHFERDNSKYPRHKYQSYRSFSMYLFSVLQSKSISQIILKCDYPKRMIQIIKDLMNHSDFLKANFPALTSIVFKLKILDKESFKSKYHYKLMTKIRQLNSPLFKMEIMLGNIKYCKLGQKYADVFEKNKKRDKLNINLVPEAW
uniref:ERAP1_C domain-containing protein n=1 Tax=Rhabditophanes sp. KR3021 TaxID=114890 RepID=A0AC35TP02_9BILA